MRFDTWAEFLEHQRRQPYMRQISEAVKAERHIATGPRRVTDPPANIYPAPEDVFRFTETPLAEVKVVILGQDPYHRRGQADGLAFSVRNGIMPPPSLINIFKELKADIPTATHCPGCNTDLTPWTHQGVLLLNTALTVREGEAGSHCDIWQPFTDEVIRAVCDSATVAPHFILWGAKAKRALERCCGKLQLWGHSHLRVDGVGTPIDPQWGLYHTVIISGRITATYSAHPSPLSADKGFFGSRPFSRANLALTLNNPGCAPVDWRLA